MSTVSYLPAAAVTLVFTLLTPADPSTSLSTTTPTASLSASAATKRKKPITKAAKEELRLYFTHAKYALNTGLPRGDYSGPLKTIVEKYDLSRDQIRLQLKNYEDATFGLSQVNLVFDSESLREKLQEALGMEPREFVSRFVSKMIDRSSSSNDFNNFAKVMEEFPDNTSDFLRSARGPESKCCVLLTGCVDHWIESSVDEFPKTAAGLSSSEVQFLKKKRIYMQGFFMREWKKQHATIYLGAWGARGNVMDMPMFCHFGTYLYNALFFDWSYSSTDRDRPDILLPEAGESLVGKYSRAVIYYVAGWVLHKMSLAETIAKGERQIYFDFVKNHTMDAESALSVGLPTRLVDKRKRRRGSKIYCSSDFYNFISFVESTFLNNLTLEMMMAYSNGDLVYAIKCHLTKNKT